MPMHRNGRDNENLIFRMTKTCWSHVIIQMATGDLATRHQIINSLYFYVGGGGDIIL